MKVSVLDHLKLEDLANYHVVCYTEVENIDNAIEANEFCRSRGIGFIMGQTYGPCGFTFLDYGDEFTVRDPDGEQTHSYIIEHINKSNPVIVIGDKKSKHNFEDGDYVTFSEVEGMTELNSLPPTQVSVINRY